MAGFALGKGCGWARLASGLGAVCRCGRSWRAACGFDCRRAFGAFSLSGALVRSRAAAGGKQGQRSEEHTSELQSLMRLSYAVFCLKQKNTPIRNTVHTPDHT